MAPINIVAIHFALQEILGGLGTYVETVSKGSLSVGVHDFHQRAYGGASTHGLCYGSGLVSLSIEYQDELLGRKTCLALKVLQNEGEISGPMGDANVRQAIHVLKRQRGRYKMGMERPIVWRCERGLGQGFSHVFKGEIAVHDVMKPP